MPKIGVVLFADIETHADMGRATNALSTVKECKQAGDEVTLIFDGAGTRWLPELLSDEHRLHRAYMAVADRSAGACRFCAVAFGVKDQLEKAGIPLLDDFEGHPSIRGLVADGYQVITF